MHYKAEYYPSLSVMWLVSRICTLDVCMFDCDYVWCTCIDCEPVDTLGGVELN